MSFRTLFWSSTILMSVAHIALLPADAATREYELTIERRDIDIAGSRATGLTVNGGIPGPTLRFTEGDTASIRVHNGLKEETSIHWHGVLVPPGMDGVPLISFPPIAPGATFTYEFPIRQSGTYWYHSHTALQEQTGIYGALVIDPRDGSSGDDRDYVVLLSDWTREDPHEVNRTLRRGSEWYAFVKGSAQSLFGAARSGRLGDFFKRELQRMPPMDIADVAYDHFLANGQPEIRVNAAPGETVRLRVVDGSATSYFHLEYAGGPMTIAAADGQDVEPFEQGRFLIAVAETYDVLVRVPAAGAWELRATAHDGSGYASVWIGSGERHPAPAVPRPDIYQAMGDLSLKRVFALTPAGTMGMPDDAVEAGRFDRPGMMDMGGMAGMDHGTGHGSGSSPGRTLELKREAEEFFADIAAPAPAVPMQRDAVRPPARESTGGGVTATAALARGGKRFASDFSLMGADASSSADLAMDGMDARPWPPYARMRAARPTAFPPEKPVREIRLTLDGDMARYVWFLNNKALSESDDILVREGEIVRFILINRTMMHHPMHLHGHFFRVVNGQGDRSPLKHTVDVAPMSTTVIEFDAIERGDWFFHCHLLYHMMNGMARVVHYEGFQHAPELVAIRPDLYRDDWHAMGQANLLSNMTEGTLMLTSTRTNLEVVWEAGWQGVGELEWEFVVTGSRYLNGFWSVFAGADLAGAGSDTDATRAVIGARTLLPLNLELRAWLDSEGGARGSLEKHLPLTPRLDIAGTVRYDTHERWEGQAGLAFMLSKSVSLLACWHSAFGFGGGLEARY
ncbi:MAG: multicopper oxidase domain-containing protein [Candidatus Methylomirabilia bacterium]